MNLQDTFYVIGIISMVLYTILLIIVVVALIMIASRIKKLYSQFEGRIDSVKMALNHPEEIASEVGAAVAGTAINQVSKVIKDRRRKTPSSKRSKRR